MLRGSGGNVPLVAGVDPAEPQANLIAAPSGWDEGVYSPFSTPDDKGRLLALHIDLGMAGEDLGGQELGDFDGEDLGAFVGGIDPFGQGADHVLGRSPRSHRAAVVFVVAAGVIGAPDFYLGYMGRGFQRVSIAAITVAALVIGPTGVTTKAIVVAVVLGWVIGAVMVARKNGPYRTDALGGALG